MCVKIGSNPICHPLQQQQPLRGCVLGRARMQGVALRHQGEQVMSNMGCVYPSVTRAFHLPPKSAFQLTQKLRNIANWLNWPINPIMGPSNIKLDQVKQVSTHTLHIRPKSTFQLIQKLRYNANWFNCPISPISVKVPLQIYVNVVPLAKTFLTSPRLSLNSQNLRSYEALKFERSYQFLSCR